MAGITGIYAFNQVGGFYMINLAKSIDTMLHRGPDIRGSFVGNDLVALGFRGFQKQESSYLGKQPFSEPNGRFTIVLDGEFYNYAEEKKALQEAGDVFISDSPAEVLLNLYINLGIGCLSKIKGGFAMAIYDAEENTLIISCDPAGIKSLLYYTDEDKFIFASEMKGMVAYNIPKELDQTSFQNYLHLNFAPRPSTFLNGILRLSPGECIIIKNKTLRKEKVNHVFHSNKKIGSFEEAKKNVYDSLWSTVEKARQNKEVAGVLIDGSAGASILASISAKIFPEIFTFSVHLKKDNREIRHYNLLSESLNSTHTTLLLGTDDLENEAKIFLKNIDAPFAKPDVLLTTYLFRKISGKVNTLLSPTGSDIFFGGRDIQRVEYLINANSGKINFMKNYGFLFKPFMKGKPYSLLHLTQESKFTPMERFWRNLQNNLPNALQSLLKIEPSQNTLAELQLKHKNYLKSNSFKSGLQEINHSEILFRLPDSLLYGWDLASSCNIDPIFPFLEREISEIAFLIPDAYKFDGTAHSKILLELMKEMLPGIDPFIGESNNYDYWITDKLKPMMLDDELLSKNYILEQNIFNYQKIDDLTKSNKGNPYDKGTLLWTVLVFQHWYKKFMNN